jgi:hypothetical protein
MERASQMRLVGQVRRSSTKTVDAAENVQSGTLLLLTTRNIVLHHFVKFTIELRSIDGRIGGKVPTQLLIQNMLVRRRSALLQTTSKGFPTP